MREFFQIGVWVVRIAERERFDVCAFAGKASRGQRFCFLYRVIRSLLFFGIARIVIVRTERESDAPPRHRRIGIKLTPLAGMSEWLRRG